jgi:F420-0:gamma-glutamyl ligase-like protein
LCAQYKAIAVEIQYLKPGYDYCHAIIQAIKKLVSNGDYVTVSEKAISTALGNIVNEKQIKPSYLAYFIAKYWMRIVWPYFLGPICHLRKNTINYLRSYPIQEGSQHKQLAFKNSSFLQTLMHGSEGGIDGSNLPYSYVSLPLKNGYEITDELRKRIKSELRKNVTVVIVDTDKTYSLRGFHFTPHPKPLKGIHCLGGFFAYLVGRSLKLQKRATPIAISGIKVTTEEAINIAKIANRTRGAGAGRTVWDMAKKFKVSLTDVSWKMLESIKHHPVVIIRYKSQRENNSNKR